MRPKIWTVVRLMGPFNDYNHFRGEIKRNGNTVGHRRGRQLVLLVFLSTVSNGGR